MDRIFTNAIGQEITVRLDQPNKSFTINNGALDSVFYTMSDDGKIVWSEGITWDHWFTDPADFEKHLEIVNWYFETKGIERS